MIQTHRTAGTFREQQAEQQAEQRQAEQAEQEGVGEEKKSQLINNKVRPGITAVRSCAVTIMLSSRVHARISYNYL